MNATARPWTVLGNYICKMNEGNHPVYVTGKTPGCTANWEANAALIVRAVNTFDEAKAVLELFKRAFPYEREFIAGSVQHKAIVARDAVLAKMEQP